MIASNRFVFLESEKFDAWIMKLCIWQRTVPSDEECDPENESRRDGMIEWCAHGQTTTPCSALKNFSATHRRIIVENTTRIRGMFNYYIINSKTFPTPQKSIPFKTLVMTISRPYHRSNNNKNSGKCNRIF